MLWNDCPKATQPDASAGGAAEGGDENVKACFKGRNECPKNIWPHASAGEGTEGGDGRTRRGGSGVGSEN